MKLSERENYMTRLSTFTFINMKMMTATMRIL